MNGALVYLCTFTNIENISSHRNKVVIYKISVNTVNFELNKLLPILLIIKDGIWDLIESVSEGFLTYSL